MRLKLLALALSCASGLAFGQLSPENPDWHELSVPAAPPLRTNGLIPIEIPRSSLHFGVDPASIAIGQEGIVRYVVVATSDSGAVNAMYEGLRCDKGEFRTYARHQPGKGWVAVDGEWRSLHDSSLARHALEIARTGACIGRSPNTSAAQIVRDLKAPAGDRFRPEIR